MKILFYGDSITDMGRNRNCAYNHVSAYGNGYVFLALSKLTSVDPSAHDIINRGISGNRIVDLYARVKCDVWNHEPDLISILIGINDIWHELGENRNGVDIARFEKVYRMLIEDTKARLPEVKLMLLEPFVLDGTATHEKLSAFEEVYDYAKVVKQIAEDYGAVFVPLQKDLSAAAEKFGVEYVLPDGVHPSIGGANIIADNWYRAFEENFCK